jgi:electron transport complex protein RnfC
MGFIEKLRRGIHPPDHKELTADKPVERLAPPPRVTIPLLQSAGEPGVVVVAQGQQVKTGELIGRISGPISAAVHSSVSGIVTEIGETILPSGKKSPAICIENDGRNEAVPLTGCPDIGTVAPAELISRIRDAGIVGMGGAGFPTHVKLTPPAGQHIDTLIVNGVECEPYINADYRLILEKPDTIVEGILILQKILGASRAFIGIERNKPAAIAAMKKACAAHPSISVATLDVRYPQGAEKVLIKSIVHKELPSGALPSSIGVAVQNLGTVHAIYEAIRFGKPLFERIVTVSGEGVVTPRNLIVPVGTPLSYLIDACGGVRKGATKIICGGPMMGFAAFSADTPVTKGMSGVIVLVGKTDGSTDDYGPCIRCGKCVNACPMRMQPALIGQFSERGQYDEARTCGADVCLECGCCAYVCPAHRPSVQFVRMAKAAKRG